MLQSGNQFGKRFSLPSGMKGVSPSAGDGGCRCVKGSNGIILVVFFDRIDVGRNGRINKSNEGSTILAIQAEPPPPVILV